MKIATEIIRSLRYKLRMMGVPLDGPANVLADNDSMVKNSTIPTQTLQKKHNAICYHYVREAVATNVMRIAYWGQRNFMVLFRRSCIKSLMSHDPFRGTNLLLSYH